VTPLINTRPESTATTSAAQAPSGKEHRILPLKRQDPLDTLSDFMLSHGDTLPLHRSPLTRLPLANLAGSVCRVALRIF
jgi:hypothetical protein